MIIRALITCLVFFAAITAPFQATAQSAVPQGVLTLEILPGWRTKVGTHMAALHITMKPGWKTYWRAPGEGGIPPRFDWSGSRNIASAEFYWPRPQVAYQNGIRTIGYKDSVVIPIEFTPNRRGKPMRIKGRVDLGVCQDICVPMSLNFTADLPDASTPDATITAALNKGPVTASRAGVTAARCTVEPISDGLRVTTTLQMPTTGNDEIAILETADQSIWVSGAQVSRSGNTLTAITEMVPPANAPFFLDRSTIRITVIGSNRMVDIRGCTG